VTGQSLATFRRLVLDIRRSRDEEGFSLTRHFSSVAGEDEIDFYSRPSRCIEELIRKEALIQSNTAALFVLAATMLR
jgi:hypothetical protein